MAVTNSDKSSVKVATRFLLEVTKRAFQQKVHSSLTLRCQINEESQNKSRVGDLCQIEKKTAEGGSIFENIR